MKRRPFSRSTPSELNSSLASLNEATKDLETALKEIEVALDKLEELSKIRKQLAQQSSRLPLLPTPSRARTEEDDRYPTSVPVYTANAIVPVLISTFFKS